MLDSGPMVSSAARTSSGRECWKMESKGRVCVCACVRVRAGVHTYSHALYVYESVYVLVYILCV